MSKSSCFTSVSVGSNSDISDFSALIKQFSDHIVVSFKAQVSNKDGSAGGVSLRFTSVLIIFVAGLFFSYGRNYI